MKIEFENIRVRLGGKEILTGTTLSSLEGKVVGIIGANGCGKSTLIKTTYSMVPYQGEIRLDGRSVREIPPRELASMVGYVGQDAACAFDFTVRDVVAMGLFARKHSGKRSAEIVDAALAELGITQFADRSIQRLSGGERKMVFIARAIAQGTDLFILDEPTNHLDIRHQLFLMDYLKQSGKTTLIVIHDLRLAAHYCDYLYLLSDGVVYAQGSPMEVLTRQNVSHVFGIDGYACLDSAGNRDFNLFDRGNAPNGTR